MVLLQVEPEVPFVPLCPLEDLPLGLGRSFEVEGMSVAVFRTRGNSVFALHNRCPHKGGALAEGMLARDQVVCPLHSFRFDPGTGKCDQEQVCAVMRYPVKVIDGVVQIGMAQNHGS